MINTNFPYGDNFSQAPTDSSIQIADDITSNEGILDNLLNILGIQSYGGNENSAVYYVQSVINYFLGILAVLSLIILIYGLYKILLTDSKFTEGVEQGKKYLKAGVLGVLGIGLSWLIVSFLFYLVSKGL